MTLLVTMLAMVAPAKHDACQTRACEERVAMYRCADGKVPMCIRRAAIRWRVSEAMLRRKAFCESRMNPRASNGTHFGLFQFAPSTFAITPYRSRSIWSAKWNSLAAAWMHHRGYGSAWACR